MAWEGRHYAQSFHIVWVNFEGAGTLDHFLYLRWPDVTDGDFHAAGTYLRYDIGPHRSEVDHTVFWHHYSLPPDWAWERGSQGFFRSLLSLSEHDSVETFREAAVHTILAQSEADFSAIARS
eukprot:3934030-Rhodomonas_salina.1